MTTPRIIGVDEVRNAITIDDLVEPMMEAFAETSAGRADNRISVLHPGDRPEDGDVHIRSGVVRGQPQHVVKIASWFRVNEEQHRRQGGLLLVLDSATGHTRALIDDHHLLTDLRTAAGSSAAVRLLGHDHVDTVTILGTGTQARLHPPAIYAQRPYRRLIVWGRHQARAQEAATQLRADLPEVEVGVEADRQTALRAADLVVTATAATEAIVTDDDLSRCRLVVAVGADDPGKCELDVGVLQRARVFVDDIELATANGSVHRAIREKTYRPDLLAGELGEVVRGTKPGRTSDSELVVSAHVGVGAQDVFAAARLLRGLTARDGVPV